MYLAYFDESGDAGYKSWVPSFTLACILVEDRSWLDLLNQTIMFRRWVRDRFELRMKQELKARTLVHGSGPWDGLSVGKDARLRIYKQALRFQEKVAVVKTFAIVIRKDKVHTQSSVDPREWAWKMAIERLERFCSAEDEVVGLYPDDGHGDFIRRMVRRKRRFSLVPSAFGTGPLDRAATCLVEDPSDRVSHHSYLVQLADLNAYAAYRCVYPVAGFPSAMWEHLGNARLAAVASKHRPSPWTGIRAFPS